MLRIAPHHGGDATDPEVPPMKYPERSQYRYARSSYRIRNWPEGVATGEGQIGLQHNARFGAGRCTCGCKD
jgi:hypothetical protein